MKRKILWFLTALAVLAIWTHSAMPKSVSMEESDGFTALFFNPVWNALFGCDADVDVVRKLAHVFEFTVLGTLLCGSLDRSVWKTFGAGFIAAFLDETVQILSQRGPQIIDVWIDLIGVTIGFGLGFLLFRPKDPQKDGTEPGREH